MIELPHRYHELWAMDKLSTHFPVVFSNTNEVESFVGYCDKCDQAIEDDMLKGTIHRHVASTATIEAVGICVPCRTLTAYNMRLHDDMRVTKLHQGRWVTYRPLGYMAQAIYNFKKAIKSIL